MSSVGETFRIESFLCKISDFCFRSKILIVNFEDLAFIQKFFKLFSFFFADKQHFVFLKSNFVEEKVDKVLGFLFTFLKSFLKWLWSFLTRILSFFSSFSVVSYSSLLITIRCLVPIRLSWRNNCKDLPKLEEVDSKLTFSLIESIVPRHLGINKDPSSGLKSPFKCSMKSLTNLVSDYMPSAGSQPKMNVKLEIFELAIPTSLPPPLPLIFLTSFIYEFATKFKFFMLYIDGKLSLQLAKRIKK